MAKTPTTRGNVAKQLNINPETLRYYETLKLINKPIRLANNYRVYNEDDIARVKFILLAKELGFSLKETKELLNLSLTEKSDREKVRTLAQRKSQIINDKISQLIRIKTVLDDLISLCHTNKTASQCPILKCLYQSN